MVATTLPAVVRVVDLPVATTVTGAELIEAVQTTAGVGVSVQLSLNQAFTSLGIPSGGATGTILNKSSGSNYSTQFSAINTFVNVGTSLATTGSATSIVAFVANQGITSTQILNNTITSTQIANNAVGTNQLASSLGIASSLSIGTLLTVGGTATFNGTAIFNGTTIYNATSVFNNGIQVTGTSQFTGTFSVAGTSLFTSGAFGVVGTTLFTGYHGIVGTSLFTSGTFGVVGTTLFTGSHGIVGTSLFTGNLSVYPSATTGFDVNYNTGTIASPSTAGNQFRVIGSNGGQVGLVMQGASFNPQFAFALASGTFQTPLAVGSGAVVGAIRAFPYNGAAYNSGPGVVFATLNAQTATDASGSIRFQVVATGSITVAEGMRLQASGGLSIGTTTDPGIGQLLVSSGILVSAGTSTFTSAFNVVGTATFTGVHGVVGTALFTSGNFGVVGTSVFTSNAFGVVGTTTLTGTLILGSQGSGFLQTSSTGVVTAAPGAGNLVLLNTLSPNNVASTNDTSSLTGTYRNYMFVFDNISPVTQTTALQMQLATSGSNFLSAGYVSLITFATGAGSVNDTSTLAVLLSGTRVTTTLQTSTVQGLCGSITLFNPSGSVAMKSVSGQVVYPSTAGATTNPSNLLSGNLVSYLTSVVSPVTGVNFLFSAGNIQTGTIKIYGMS